jgi:hypothetical protein
MATSIDAAARAAAVFNRARRANDQALPKEFPQLEESIAQYYGAVGGVLCSTLWDPGSSVNLITPEFAKEIAKTRTKIHYIN